MNLRSFLFIFSSFFLGACTSSQKFNTSSPNLVKPAFAAPAVVIYKTNKNYNDKVAVTMSEDKKTILNYPDPKDVSKDSEPTILKDGYLLDNRGISANTAFLNITYAEYSKLSQLPTPSQLMQWMADDNAIIEMYNCGASYSYTDKVSQINQIIKSGKMETIFKKIK